MRRIKLIIALLFPVLLYAQEPVTLQPWMEVEGTYNGQSLGRRVGFVGKFEDSTKITVSDINGINIYHIKDPNDTVPRFFFSGINGSLGDFNGDGIHDLLVRGNPTKIYLGISHGVFDTIPSFVKFQEEEGFAFGRQGATGYLNEDDYEDLVITDMGYPNGDYVGRVYVYLGAEQMDTIPDVILNGERMFSEFGVGVVCGDLNDDGFDEIIVKGYDGNDFNINQDFAYIKVYLGGNQIDTLEWKYLKGGGHLSSGVECFDVNGDNKKDLLWTDYSKVDSINILNIHFSQEGNIDTIASMVIFNEWAYNVTNAGDMNGDGYNEILLSSNYHNIFGDSFIFIYGGGPNMDIYFDAAAALGGESNFGTFGRTVSVEDINNDGYEDILIGAPTYQWFTNQGYFTILLGSPDIPVTSVKENEVSLPSNYKLFQNFPNPFNPSTIIQYAIGNRQFVTIEIYDVLGKEIKTLVNEEQEAGVYQIEFDAQKYNLSSGVYYYKLTLTDSKGNEQSQTKSMILLK